MKILAFAASNNINSINAVLAQYAANLVEGADIELLDINDYEMPLYRQDREELLGQPEAAKKFFAKLGNADAIIISFAEHNGTYTAAYKNLFDWTSRINQKLFQQKPLLLLATSPGPGGAKTVLNTAVTSAPYFAGDVKASFSVPSFYENFDSENNQFINQTLESELKDTVALLIKG